MHARVTYKTDFLASSIYNAIELPKNAIFQKLYVFFPQAKAIKK